MIYVFAFTIILGLIQSKKNQSYALSIILSCTVISETIIASTDHYVANQTKTAYTEDYDGFKELQAVIDEKDNSLFYRSELSDLRTRMDPSWYDYNGVSVFSSMAYENVANLQKAIGLYGNKINSYTYNPQTPIYNSMFSLKYIYDRNNLISEGEFYNLVDMIVVGQFCGQAGLSAVSVGGDLMNLFVFSSMGLCSAGQVIISQYVGKKEYKMSTKSFVQTVNI
jgi:hypothetical protein